MVRMQIALAPAEADALLKLANSELRDPREEMRIIVRRELVRRKLLPPETRVHGPVASGVKPV